MRTLMLLTCRRKTLLPGLVLLAACGVHNLVRAGDLLEQQVKAAMLYNFIHFVEWPSVTWKDSTAPVIVAVAGPDSLVQTVEAATRGKSRGGHPFQTRRVQNPADISGSAVLFISSSGRGKLDDYLRVAQSSGILTVSDLSGFVKSGGMIGFVVVDGHIRFQINEAAASKAGLSLSSQLLELAVSNDTKGAGN